MERAPSSHLILDGPRNFGSDQGLVAQARAPVLLDFFRGLLSR